MFYFLFVIQWGFDVPVVEAYINDHKQQRRLLLARSTLELSNQLLHEYSSEATVDYKNLNVDLDKYTRVNPNQVTALRCQFTPEYTRPAAIGTTRALLQGVEFQKWNGKATDDKETPDDGGNTDGGGHSFFTAFLLYRLYKQYNFVSFVALTNNV